MLRRKPPPELGALIEVHRPLHPAAGWAIITTLPLSILLIFLLLASEAIIVLVGLPVFVCLLIPLAYGLGKLLLLEHRLYEHGIVFRAMLIGTPTYVVPHYTVLPHALRIRQHHLDWEAEWKADHRAPDRRYRHSLFTKQSVCVYGLDPEYALRLGKGKLGWTEAGHLQSGPSLNGAPRPSGRASWEAGYRNAERHMKLIGDVVRRSRDRYPDGKLGG
ncbi:hypothetical protein LHJ74_20910 [Streptomyces sp. N2-109]|uniref:Uncharacterized protein n=1 Tax=Streptomyces gossypii TaxID=2883101 RepID=A0ABT2JWQ2_9ACTN|nr:hypothetical protein [Streptomyces gossypii]MCT2592334.1 hypothetical protein [Streptomyces gossypii]